MDPEEAKERAAKGTLVGKGCEAHEQKDAARKERLNAKRQMRNENRKKGKELKKEAKAKRKTRDGTPDVAEVEGVKRPNTTTEVQAIAA